MDRLSDYKFSQAADFAKVAVCCALSKGFQTDAINIARSRYGADIEDLMREAQLTKASPQLSTAAPWSGWASASKEFVSIVYERSIVGRLPDVRRVPFRQVALVGTDAAASWTGEGEEKTISEVEVSSVMLDPFKVGAIAVVSEDALKAQPEAGQRMLFDAKTRASVLAFDTIFISGDAQSSAHPAGILNAPQTVASTGVTQATIAHDLAAMIALLSDAGIALSGAVWIMSPGAYGFLRLLKVADADGSVAGFPVLTSDSASGAVALLSSQYLAFAGSDVATLSASTQATVKINSAQVSLFQANLLGVRSEIFASWALVSPQNTSGENLAVASLTSATWA